MISDTLSLSPHRRQGLSSRGEGLLRSAAKCPLPVQLLLLSYLLPIGIAPGGFLVTPTRVVLISYFIPAISCIARSRRILAADVLVAVHVMWVELAMAVNDGVEVLFKSGGIYGVETLGAYLIARAYIRTWSDLRRMAATLIFVVLALLPVTLIETFTSVNILQRALGVGEGSGDARHGFFRAMGSFQNPILFGGFAASSVAFAIYAIKPRTARLGVMPLLTSVCAATSVSSGAVVSLGIQWIIWAWDRVTRGMAGRWRIMALGIGCVYVAVSIASNRTPQMVFLHYATFDRWNAYIRVYQFNYGMDTVWRHPFVGLGYGGDWDRPVWMPSSVDNMWLVIALRWGLPAFVALAGAAIWLLIRNGRECFDDILPYRKGWMCSFAGMIITAATVHFWHNAFVHFCFLIGVGSATLAFGNRASLHRRRCLVPHAMPSACAGASSASRQLG